MKILFDKSDRTKAVILAFGEDDVKTLSTLYHNQIIFGLWKIWIKDGDKGVTRPDIAPVLKAFPQVGAIAWCNLVKAFAREDVEEIADGTKEQSQLNLS